MSYQICPKCKGTGNKYDPIYTGNPLVDIINSMPALPYKVTDENKNVSFKMPDNKCPVCKGKMIISSETGLPPQDAINLKKNNHETGTD